MTKLLIKLFVKDSTNVHDKVVRTRYGILSSVVGIILNILLFIVKYILGSMSGSIAITSSAFDHLSDCASCIVTLFGAKLSLKPADKDHPFGHGRVEYVATFIISSLILVMGIQLFRSAVEKVFEPNKIVFSYVVIISLVLSLLVKLWMSFFNQKIGKTISSKTMLAAAVDSRNDCLNTIITIISASLSPFVSFPLDGVLGALVSVFIIKNGIDLIKDTVDDLLGKPADRETTEAIKSTILSNSLVCGVHDLMIHNYGPGNLFGSCHVEVDKVGNIADIHDLIDRIERDIFTKDGIIMTIHMDPVDFSDPLALEYKKTVEDALLEHNSQYKVHDFRMVTGNTHTNLVFDVVVPFDVKIDKESVETIIKNKLLEKYPEVNFYLVITYDRDFCL